MQQPIQTQHDQYDISLFDDSSFFPLCRLTVRSAKKIVYYQWHAKSHLNTDLYSTYLGGLEGLVDKVI